jgi:hypothetical protein
MEYYNTPLILVASEEVCVDDMWTGYQFQRPKTELEATQMVETAIAKFENWRKRAAGEVRLNPKYEAWFGSSVSVATKDGNRKLAVTYAEQRQDEVYVRGEDSNARKSRVARETSRQTKVRKAREAGRNPRKAKLQADI